MENPIEVSTPQETSSSTPAVSTSQRSKPNPIYFAVALILFLIVGIGGFYLGQMSKSQPKKTEITTTVSPTEVAHTDITQMEDPNTLPSGWQTISSKTVGYSMNVPPNWRKIYDGDSLSQSQEYGVSMVVQSEKGYGEGPAEGINGITILFPITIGANHESDLTKEFDKGLDGLAQIKSNEKVEFKTIGKYRVLFKTIPFQAPPPDYDGDGFCNCTTKHAYIDLGGEILDMSGQWEEDNSEFEKTFDQIISTFKFTGQTSTSDTSFYPAYRLTLPTGYSLKSSTSTNAEYGTRNLTI